jgi:hypothetical protein
MRAAIVAFLSGLALAAAAVQAAPQPPGEAPAAELGAAPPIELVAGCGWGWHRVHWQDHWGDWHWHCVPNGHVHHWHGGQFEHPYSDWRGPSGGWGNP